MEFQYDPSPQRSPEWLARKRGKIGASRLTDWLAVSKAKNSIGKPLKARLDYEKELMFERQFGVSFNTWVSDAMQDGIDYEDFARQQYAKLTDLPVLEVGCWYNDYFVASPDRAVGDDGLIEIKILKDNSWTEVLVSGVPEKHWNQIQGQLWASGRKWCDYVALNFNTKKFIVIRVEPDKEFHEYLVEAVKENLVQAEFALTNVHDIVGEVPDGVVMAFDSANKSNNDWSQ